MAGSGNGNQHNQSTQSTSQYWMNDGNDIFDTSSSTSTLNAASSSSASSSPFTRNNNATTALQSTSMERGSSGTSDSAFTLPSERSNTLDYTRTRVEDSNTRQDNAPYSSPALTSSPSLSTSSGRGSTFSPPPRRPGSSLPLPFNPNQATSLPTATSSYHVSPSLRGGAESRPPSYRSSSSSHQYRFSSPQQETRTQRLKRTLNYSYEGISELLYIIYPNEWKHSLFLTDQASWSLICYKLYVLSITIPFNSKLYFYYLPSCLLSDLIAVAILQFGWWFLFGDKNNNNEDMEYTSSFTPLIIKKTSWRAPLTTLHHEQDTLGTKENNSWKSSLRNLLRPILRKTPFINSYTYTPLPFDTSMNNDNTVLSAADIETPLNTTNLRNDSSDEVARGGSIIHSAGTASTGLGINGITHQHSTQKVESEQEEEEGKALLSTWEENEENPSIRANSNNTANRHQNYEWKEEDIHHEDITLVQEEGEEGNSQYNNKKVEYDEEVLREALGTNKKTFSSILKGIIWITLKSLHMVACLVAVVFTVIAIGAYSAGRVVFSWQGAFDSSSQTSYLFGYAMTEFPHFLATYATILGLTIGTMLLRCWIPHWIDNGTLSSAKVNKYIIPAGKKTRIALASLAVIGFLSICAAVRPPKALPATDLLIDGVTATSAILFFKHDHTHPLALNKNTTIYGQSNAFQPRLTPINTEEIKHVFFIFLESADYLAWPYQPELFCKHRNCEDMNEKYNKVEEFTPFFNDLIKNDKNTVFIKNFRTNLAYTIKAHLASMCGILPHIHDFISSEAELDSPTGCLPHLLKALSDDITSKNKKDKRHLINDIEESNNNNNTRRSHTSNSENGNGSTRSNGRTKKWRSGWFQAQMTAYDKQHQVIEREGFEEIWDSNTLTAKFGRKKEWTNYFGYADEELYPFVWDWIDDRLKNDENVFMATAGATMHHPFTVPSWVEKTEYTKTEWTNNYLNVVKRTDRDLKLFFDGLKSRNLLDKSLIIMQGDHGPRIGEDGIYVDNGWQERIYRAPLAIRAPGLLPHQIEQDPTRPYIALDILPTILDALGVKPSIIKSFVGQSIFRARSQRHLRDSYHAQSRGGQFPHHLRTLRHNTYKAIRMEAGDTCATDVNVDPTEIFFYCVNEGWREVFEGEDLKDGLVKGLWKEGSKEEKALIQYAHEAKALMDNHLEVNRDFWDVEKHKEENKELKEKFLAAVHEQSHWH